MTSLLFATSAPAPSAAAPPSSPDQLGTARTVLDIQKLRGVTAPKEPNLVPTCDVLVVGGGLGGVAAAEALARRGRSVILVEPTSMLGGQLTAQIVPVPDENSYIERTPGVGTRSYRELREQVRAKYAAEPGIKPGMEKNVGQAWVSRVSGEPAVWEAAVRERLETLRGMGGLKQVLLRHQLVSVHRFPESGRFHYAEFVDLDTGRLTRISAQFMLDATEFGDGLLLAGSPWTVGAEARREHNEPHAPEEARPDWIQSFTYCFVLRWTPNAPHQLVEKPPEYDYFKSLGEYTLGYDYSDERGRVYYKVFKTVPGAGGPFWTYRRLVAAASFKENPRYETDLSLINWRGNDFHEENPIGHEVEEQIRILQRGKWFAQGFLYWLQNECPRDDGGYGYPEMQLAADLEGSDAGFALHPYIRESRRLQAQFTLTENHLAPDANNPDKKMGEEFFDSVGTALYAMDIHPAKGEPPFLSRALPYHIPLGSFIPRSGPDNVLPAAKNFGATRLALSSARMHPTEWLAGEIAGHLAAFCLQHRVVPAAVRGTPELLSAFQAGLREAGVPLSWREILESTP
jgi:hypothetical protein